MTSVDQPSQTKQVRTQGSWLRPLPGHWCSSAEELLSQTQQCAGGGHTGRPLVDTVVIIQKPRQKLCLWIVAASKTGGQFRAEGQSQPLYDNVEFSAEASVDPKVEDAVEETVGSWQPHHHKFHPLRHTATWECCGVETSRWAYNNSIIIKHNSHPSFLLTALIRSNQVKWQISKQNFKWGSVGFGTFSFIVQIFSSTPDEWQPSVEKVSMSKNNQLCLYSQSWFHFSKTAHGWG